MLIKILGTGCPNCQKLEENAKLAIGDLKLEDVLIEHVREIDEIINYGVMSTPAIVIDEEVKGSGRVFEVEEIKEWLK